MKIYSLYDAEGRVFSVLSLQQEGQIDMLRELNGAAGFVMGSVDGKTHFVLNETVSIRPENPAVQQGNSLLNLPVPCSISINGQEYVCSEGHADLEFDQPGRYAIVVRAWPHLDKEFTLENSAP